MKKVVFVTSCLGVGGAERVVAILASRLAKMHFDVSVYALLNKDRDYFIDESVKYKYLGADGNKLNRYIKILINLRRELKNNRPEVVISFLNIPNIITILATRFIKTKVIVSERNNPYITPKKIVMRILRDWSYNFADTVVFQTQDAKEYFNKKIQSRGIIIPNPIKKEMLEPYCGIREKRIVAIGRLVEQKNFSLLLSGFAEFIKIYSDYKLEIFGDGLLKEQLQRQAIELGIIEKVSFKGYVHNIHEQIYKAAMYVSTSDYEGISNSMLEAMALGIPTIATDCPIGGARMAINNGHNGVLIQVGALDELVVSMKRVVEHEDFARRIGNEAIKIKETYNEDVIAQKWVELI